MDRQATDPDPHRFSPFHPPTGHRRPAAGGTWDGGGRPPHARVWAGGRHWDQARALMNDDDKNDLIV